MFEDLIVPEFKVYSISEEELEELSVKIDNMSSESGDRFRIFTDVLIEYVPSGEWMHHSDSFLAMIARACYIRGMYGYLQVLAKSTDNVSCLGYAAASYCRQSLNPRWLSNLEKYVNQAWQKKEYITYTELSAVLAEILFELGYNDHAERHGHDTIERVTEATKTDAHLKHRIQAVLLDTHIVLARIAAARRYRDEALMRLDSAEATAKKLGNRLASGKILYVRAYTFIDCHEFNRAMKYATEALRLFEAMGYLEGVASARNLRGIVYTNLGQFQDARDQFEEQMIIQQRLNNQIGLARALINIGEVDGELGQYDQMEVYNLRALEISQEAEYTIGIAVSTINLGNIALKRAKFDEAIKRYNEGLAISRNAGLGYLIINVLFLMGDAYFLQQDYNKAIEIYQQARSEAKKAGAELDVFLSDVSTIMVYYNRSEAIPHELVSSVTEVMEPLSKWSKSSTPEMVVDLRRRIFEDKMVSSSTCIFFDREMNFSCRVNRDGLRKECFGNLLWMGSFCPYFLQFVNILIEAQGEQ